MKKVVALMLTMLLLCSWAGAVNLYIDTEKIETDVPPTIVDNRTFVPVRAIFESLGATVEWDDSTRTATGTTDDTVVVIQIDNSTAYVNGEERTLDVPAQIINNRTMVPARFVSEALGCDVTWDAKTQTAAVAYEMADQQIYVTATGARYHFDNSCNGGTYYEATLAEAMGRGLTPCEKCIGNSASSVTDNNNETGTQAYIVINDNVPYFSEDEMNEGVFETYSSLDELGRCGVAFANICQEIMPTEPRGEIGSVQPSGWHTIRYDDLIDGDYLYNRCHLIGYQLAGENANECNLITGTRFLNTEGMLPFENMVADYVQETGNHVLYRVTPDFQGNELVARGVQMEAYSIEDNGAGICFNIYAYNIQPGIIIDYSTGDSQRAA